MMRCQPLWYGAALSLSFALLAQMWLSVVASTPNDSDAPNSEDHLHQAYKVLRITTVDAGQSKFLMRLRRMAPHYRFNFWTEPSEDRLNADVMIPPEYQRHVERMLDMRNISYKVQIDDVQKLIEEYSKPPQSIWPKGQPVLRDHVRRSSRSFDYRQYHSYDEMCRHMQKLARSHPHLAKMVTIGYTHMRNPIELIQIGYPVDSTSKKGIWIDGGIHAREWASPTTAMYAADALVNGYGHDPLITNLCNKLTWYIAPVLNPDGYGFTRSSTHPEVRLWRKNMSPPKCQRGYCCKGVDLNRNFDFHFGGLGGSDNPCEEIYQGEYPFSEPESQAVKKFLLNHYNIDAFINLHTYSQLWIHPFGHAKHSYPKDVKDLVSTAAKAAGELQRMYGTKYRVGSGADTLYPASGGMADWVKKNHPAKYVYLIELRPGEEVTDGFILKPSLILPTAVETWQGIKTVAEAVLRKNRLA